MSRRTRRLDFLCPHGQTYHEFPFIFTVGFDPNLLQCDEGALEGLDQHNPVVQQAQSLDPGWMEGNFVLDSGWTRDTRWDTQKMLDTFVVQRSNNHNLERRTITVFFFIFSSSRVFSPVLTIPGWSCRQGTSTRPWRGRSWTGPTATWLASISPSRVSTSPYLICLHAQFVVDPGEGGTVVDLVASPDAIWRVIFTSLCLIFCLSLYHFMETAHIYWEPTRLEKRLQLLLFCRMYLARLLLVLPAVRPHPHFPRPPASVLSLAFQHSKSIKSVQRCSGCLLWGIQSWGSAGAPRGCTYKQHPLYSCCWL